MPRSLFDPGLFEQYLKKKKQQLAKIQKDLQELPLDHPSRPRLLECMLHLERGIPELQAEYAKRTSGTQPSLTEQGSGAVEKQLVALRSDLDKIVARALTWAHGKQFMQVARANRPPHGGTDTDTTGLDPALAVASAKTGKEREDTELLAKRVTRKLDNPGGNPTMTVEEVAHAFSVTKSTIYRWVTEGRELGLDEVSLTWLARGKISTELVRRALRDV